MLSVQLGTDAMPCYYKPHYFSIFVFMVCYKDKKFMEIICLVMNSILFHLVLTILSAGIICYNVYIQASVMTGRSSNFRFKYRFILKPLGWGLLGFVFFIDTKNAFLVSIIFMFSYFILLRYFTRRMNSFFRNR